MKIAPATVVLLAHLLQTGALAQGPSFSASRTISAEAVGTPALIAHDMDGDGDLDVVTMASSPVASVGWFENLGGGTFSSRQVISTDIPEGTNHGSLAASDFDGDGDVDLIACTAPSIGITVPFQFSFIEKLDGSEWAVVGVTPTFNGGALQGNQRVEFADLDGDGDDDLLAVPLYGFSFVMRSENLGGGNFGPWSTLATPIGCCIALPSAIALADADGDGDLDLYHATNELIFGCPTRLYRNFGNGLFALASPTPPSHCDTHPFVMDVADVNGDGSMDLIIGGAQVVVHSDDPTAGTQILSGSSWRMNSIEAVDLDLDGDLDILCGGFEPGDFSNVASPAEGPDDFVWFENSGGGAFGPSRVFDTTSTPRHALSADLDGDGDPDVLWGSDSELAWFENITGECTVETYCPANVNTSGLPGVLGTTGTPSLQAADLTFEASQLPADQFGYLIASTGQDLVPFFAGGDGSLCLAAPLVHFRSLVQSSGSESELSFALDFRRLPRGTVFLPGDTWNFQVWFRDKGDAPAHNTTNAVQVTWCP